MKGNWGDLGAMRAAESTEVGGFTAGGAGGKSGSYSRMQTPNTRNTEYVSVKMAKGPNPDRASVNGATLPASETMSGRVKGR